MVTRLWFFLGTATLLVAFGGVQLMAQNPLTVQGVVRDAATKKALPYAAIAVKGSTLGVYSDTLGQFTLTLNSPADTLEFSSVGYETQIRLGSRLVTNQILEIQLEPIAITLKEMVFTGDPNPGKSLMKKVIARNRQNDPARFKRIDALRWTRAEVSVLDPVLAQDTTGQGVFKGGILFRARAKAFEQVRQADDPKIGYLPLFFAERVGHYSLTNDPYGENVALLAVKTTNLSSDKLLEPLARWDAGAIELYKPRVLLFGRAFVSPIGLEGLGFYDFYIQDSLALGPKHWQITLQVVPKVWEGNVFSGTIAVEDSAFAVLEADLRLSKAANLNFIEGLGLQQRFSRAFDQQAQAVVYVLQQSTLSINYETGPQLLGIPLPANAKNKRIISKMTAVYDSIRVNQPGGPPVKIGALTTVLRSVDSGASEEFWQRYRPDSLSTYEQTIYAMADILRNDPKQKFKDRILSIFSDGNYYFDNWGYLGPAGAISSFNEIEGFRFRLGFHTLQDLSKKVGVYGHFAYGVGDSRWKGGLGAKLLWREQPYSRTGLFWGSDYGSLIQWNEEPDEDGFANSVLRKNVPFFLIFQREFNFTHDQQLGANWYGFGGFSYRSIDPSFPYQFPNPAYSNPDRTPQEPINLNTIYTAELTLSLRFAWKERSRIYEYTRLPMGSRLPTAALFYVRGIPMADAPFDYQKVHLVLAHNFRITPKVDFYWRLEGGQVFGTVPSLLLQVPRGNNAYVIQREQFNTMVPFEFTADRYASLKTRLAMGGFFLDRVPFLKKLGWRERMTFNAFWGDLSTANRTFNAQQTLLVPDREPFAEIGIGLENIFHFVSIDYIRRINYLNSVNLQGNTGGIFLGMKAAF